MKAGTLINVSAFAYVGNCFFCNNLRGVFSESRLTAARTFTFPNKDVMLIGVGSKSGATTTISNTTTETDMLSYTVGANSIGANGVIRFKISGYLLQNQVT